MKTFWIGATALGLALGLWASCGGDDSGTPDGGADVGETSGDGDASAGCVRTDECHQGYRCESGSCVMVLPDLSAGAADLSCLDGCTPACTDPQVCELGACVDPPPPEGTFVTATIYVEDFEDDYRVEGATIDLFLDNTVDTPDATIGPTDVNGSFLVTPAIAELPAGRAIAYRVHAGDLPAGAVRTTIEYDVRIPAVDGEEVRFLSVSDSTYRLIPTILGITPDASHGIIAGEFGDCSTNSVEGVVARLVNDSDRDCHDLNPRECYSRYFVDDFPTRIDNQTFSSPDGLYAIAQVAPGEWDLEILGRLSASSAEYPFDLLGSKRVNCIADSIVIVDVPPLETAAP